MVQLSISKALMAPRGHIGCPGPSILFPLQLGAVDIIVLSCHCAIAQLQFNLLHEAQQ